MQRYLPVTHCEDRGTRESVMWMPWLSKRNNISFIDRNHCSSHHKITPHLLTITIVGLTATEGYRYRTLWWSLEMLMYIQETWLIPRPLQLQLMQLHPVFQIRKCCTMQRCDKHWRNNCLSLFGLRPFKRLSSWGKWRTNLTFASSNPGYLWLNPPATLLCLNIFFAFVCNL